MGKEAPFSLTSGEIGEVLRLIRGIFPFATGYDKIS